MIEINGKKYYTKDDILQLEEENRKRIIDLETITSNLMKDPYYYYHIYDFSDERDIKIGKGSVSREHYRSTVSKDGCNWHIAATNYGTYIDHDNNERDVFPTISTYNGKTYLRIFGRFGIVLDDSSLNVKSVTIAFQNEDMADAAYEYMTTTREGYCESIWIDKAELNGRILTVYADFSKGWNLFGNYYGLNNFSGVGSVLIEYVKINVD